MRQLILLCIDLLFLFQMLMVMLRFGLMSEQGLSGLSGSGERKQLMMLVLFEMLMMGQCCLLKCLKYQCQDFLFQGLLVELRMCRLLRLWFLIVLLVLVFISMCMVVGEMLKMLIFLCDRSVVRFDVLGQLRLFLQSMVCVLWKRLLMIDQGFIIQLMLVSQKNVFLVLMLKVQLIFLVS